MRKATKQEKETYVNIAKDLCYPDSVIAKLYTANTLVECERILTNARLEACKV